MPKSYCLNFRIIIVNFIVKVGKDSRWFSQLTSNKDVTQKVTNIRDIAAKLKVHNLDESGAIKLTKNALSTGKIIHNIRMYIEL